MVGGAPVTQAYADKIGADIYGDSASETTAKAKAISK
jgi:dimethylamine corrinoid protein